MLPKPEKNKKNLVSSPENDTSVDPQIAQKRLKTKRKLVLLSLFLTAGISFIFWSYRATKDFLKSPPKFNLNFNFKLPDFKKNNQTKIVNSNPDIIKLIEASSESWSIYSSFISNPNLSIFEYKPESITNNISLEDVVDQISLVKLNSTTTVNLNLPQGLSFQESIESSSSSYFYKNIISFPKNKLLILIKIDQPKNIDQIKKQIPLLVDKIYWHSVSQLN